MATKPDVLTARDTSLAACDAHLVAFATIQNAASQADSDRMEPHMRAIRAKRTALAVQHYQRALDDPTFKDALDKIQAATTDMKTVADNIKKVTDFLNKVADFLTALGKIGTALAGP